MNGTNSRGFHAILAALRKEGIEVTGGGSMWYGVEVKARDADRARRIVWSVAAMNDFWVDMLDERDWLRIEHKKEPFAPSGGDPR